MQSLRQLFTRRSTILLLIVLSLVVMLTGSFVPQTFLMTATGLAKWHAEHPALAAFSEKLGLSSIFTHPLLALLLLAASISLAISCFDRACLALTLYRGGCSDDAGWRSFKMGSVPEKAQMGSVPKEVAEYLGGQGYVERGGCFVKGRYGYWGATVLHAGFLVVIVVSLWMALTQQRGLVSLVETESFSPGQSWALAEQGLLARPLVLDDVVRLDRVDFELWPSYATKSVGSQLSFLGRDGVRSGAKAEVNTVLLRNGVRVYQTLEFGLAFELVAADRAGKTNVTHLLIPRQSAPDKPEYATYADFPEKGRTLRAKYFAEIDRSSLEGKNPELILRLDEHGMEGPKTSLVVGATAELAGCSFKLAGVRRWANLTFVKLNGVDGLLAGFAMICLGCLLHYFAVPRVVVLKNAADGMQLCWHGERFEEFYLAEFEALKRKFEGKPENG